MKKYILSIFSVLMLVALFNPRAYAGCAPGETYLLIQINADAYFETDPTVITVTVGGVVAYTGTPLNGSMDFVVDGCFPEGATVSIDYTDTFGDGILVSPPAFIFIGCGVATGVVDGTAAAGNLFTGVLTVDFDDIASNTTGSGAAVGTSNPATSGIGCTSGVTNSANFGTVAISPTISNSMTPPAFPSGVTPYPVCDVAGGATLGQTLTGALGQTEPIEICATWTQPNATGNETGTYVGLLADPGEVFGSSPVDMNGDGNGANDCGFTFDNATILDAGCNVVATNIGSAGATGLIPGATYTLCATAIASSFYQGADGLLGTADDGPPADGSCFVIQVGLAVQPFESACPTINPINTSNTICDGALAAEIADWQTAVAADATNAAAIADANTDAAIVYSTVAVPADAAAPNTLTADGVHSDPTNTACADDVQTTYAYLFCNTDNSYLLLGTHTLTVNPPAQAPSDMIVDCVNTPMRFCGNEGFGVTAINATGGADVANWNGSTYTAQPGDLAGTVTITVTTVPGACEGEFAITTPACPAECPAVGNINGGATICDGDLANEIIDWQAAVAADPANAAAIADANTAAAIEYSTVVATPPNGLTATGVYAGDPCGAAEVQPTFAYLLCFGPDATQGTDDDEYLALGTYDLTVNPNTATLDTPAAVDCAITLAPVCANDVLAATATVTGDADPANFDAATGTYTAQSGDMSGTIEITVTNAVGCNPVTVVLQTPACLASCPAVVAVNDADTVCDGALMTEINTWQADVAADATNAAAIADVNTSATIQYSTVIDTPDGNTATGVFGGADACATEDQLTYAYLLCFGDDATEGTGDDTFLLLGTHTLTVQPNTQIPDDPTPAGCAVTLVGQCANETLAAVAGSETGDAAIANFDAATGVYTALPADAAGTIEVTVTNSFACTPVTYTLTTPACPDTGVCAITPDAATNIVCDDNGTPADPADDTYTFDIVVNGSNTQVGASGTFTDDQGALSSLNGTAAAYGAMVSYGPYPISGVSVTVTFADVDDAVNCTNTMMAAAPATCSGAMCSITPDAATNIVCDDNGTPADPNDDTYTFDILVNGSSTFPGATNTFSDDQGNVGIAYGMTVSYGPYDIANGNTTVIFTDTETATCTNTMMAAAPMTCSTQMTGIDISDPCSCDAPIVACAAPAYPYTGGTNVPGNIDVDGDGSITNNGMDLVADVIEVVVNNPIAGETFTVAAAGTAVNCDGTPIAVGDAMTETAPGSGVYQLVVYYPADGTGYGTLTFDADMGSPSATISNPSAEYMPCVCEPCEDAIAGTITLAGCDFSSAMVEIYDANNLLVATATVDAMGNYALPGPFECGTYSALIVNAPACYIDAGGDLSPRTFTVDGDGTADGFNFMVVPENIPTVGEWGLIILGLLMSITAIVGIRQRREEENQVWS